MDDLQHIGPRLLKRTFHSFAFAPEFDFSTMFVQFSKIGDLPILHLQHEQATARMENYIIGISSSAAYRHVEPDEVIVLKVTVEALSKTPFPRGHRS